MQPFQKSLPVIAIGFGVLFLAFVLLFSSGIVGITDSVMHYLYARYAFKYPAHFLDHWGKPLFIMLSAPLSQLGFKGAVAFNLICGSIAAWLLFKIAKKLGKESAWAVILMLIFLPVYFANMNTSLTEVLGSLVLVTAIYLFLYQKFIAAAIVISFLPYARTEGMMFITLFILAFFWMKSYRAIPFLLVGFLFFSITGMIVYGDFWWFFTSMPYRVHSSEIYGSGSFFFYIGRFHEIMGYPLVILAVIGIFDLAWRWYRTRPARRADWTTEFFILPAAFLGFILAQSFLWWQGMMGVLAAYRFMVVVLPLGAIFYLLWINVVMKMFSFNRTVQYSLFAMLIISVMIMPFVT
jgi:hypothetical protein